MAQGTSTNPPTCAPEDHFGSTREVSDDHIRLHVAGELEKDLQRNYANHVVLLTVNSNAGGHDPSAPLPGDSTNN